MTPTSTTCIQVDEVYVTKSVTALEVTSVIHQQLMTWLDNLEGRYKLASTRNEFDKLNAEREVVGNTFQTLFSEIDKLFNS